MTDAPASEALDPRRAAHLTDFARGCSAAARAVSLYPAGHPSVETAITRLVETAERVTSARAFRLTVLPDGLLLDGLAPAKPDQAVPEIARLLHQHFIGGFVLHDGCDAMTWHTLLTLLARPPEEVRVAGGIGHMWSDKGGLTTADHRCSIELREVDYERLLLSRALGDPATLEQIFDSLFSGETGSLDPSAHKMLGEMIHDSATLELFATELARRVGPDAGAHAETLLHLLRSAVELTTGDDDVLRDEAMGNLAKVLTGLNAETMADLLRRRGTPAAMAGGRDVVDAVTDQVDGLSREAVHRVGLDGRIVVGALSGDAVEELQGPLEVARQGEVLDVTADRAGDIAPAKRVAFHVQEIEQQLQVERPERRVADCRQPRVDPLLRVVADVLDLGRLCSRDVQLAGVLVAHELLVAIRRHQRLGLFPDVREGVGLSERGLGQLFSHERHHLTPIVEVGHQGLERLGEPV